MAPPLSGHADAERARPAKALDIQRLERLEDIAAIRFTDGVAALEVPIELARAIRFKNHHREESPRLEAVRRSILARGFVPLDPILCRLGHKGRWVVMDGGHRLTAALEIDDSFWDNLFGRKVDNLYILLFETARSQSVQARAAALGLDVDAGPDDPDAEEPAAAATDEP